MLYNTSEVSDLYLSIVTPGEYPLSAPSLPSLGPNGFMMNRSITKFAARSLTPGRPSNALIADLSSLNIFSDPTSCHEREILSAIKSGALEFNQTWSSKKWALSPFLSVQSISALKVNSLIKGIDLVSLNEKLLKDLKQAVKGISTSSAGVLDLAVKVNYAVYSFEPTISIRSSDIVIGELKIDPFQQNLIRIIPSGPLLDVYLKASKNPQHPNRLSLRESHECLTAISDNLKKSGYFVTY